MGRIITLTGPSQSGKSTAKDFFLKHSHKEGEEDGWYYPISIPKYNTRKPRKDDKPDEVISRKVLPKKCDLVYQQYDVRYGFSSKDLLKKLQEGFICLIVINDVRTISEVKRIFGKLCKSIYLHRQAISKADFIAEAKKRGNNDDKMIEKRIKKAEAIYRIYIENIDLFDNVLLNSSNEENLEAQIIKVIESLNIKNQHYFK